MRNLLDNLKNWSQSNKNLEIFSRATLDQVIKILLLFLIILIPFSVRHVFNTTWNFQTGAYSDFTSLSIYLSDIILILFISAVWISDIHFKFSTQNPQNSGQTGIKLWKWSGLLLVIWLIVELYFSNSLPLQTYFTGRVILLIIFAFSLYKINVPREKIAWLFTILGFLQSITAVVQFYSQKSLGLYLIGESHLNSTMFGVAKIVSHGTTLIRGYGTFPHANLLSAFLVVATLFNLYLLTKTRQRNYRKYHVVGLYVFLIFNIFGLFLTFSRGGIIAFGAALLGTLIVFLINKQYLPIKTIIVSCGTGILLSIIILWPHLSSRATFSDQSTKERVFYNEVGLKMVKDEPILGQGAGTSVLHMKQYSQENLNSWEIQPIHNYYLISLAEMGFGAILLIFIIAFPIIGLFKALILSIKHEKLDPWNLTILAIAGAFLLLFCLDHYFYTIWPTQILLWLMIGLAIETSFTWNNQIIE